MGRKQFLTVRKRRCNERQTLKQRKQEKLLKKTHLIQRVYGIQGSIAPKSCVSESNDDATMDMEREEKIKDTECDEHLSEYDEQPEVGYVECHGCHVMEYSKYDNQPDLGDSECGRHEMELENDECDSQPEIRDIECKGSSDECLEEVSGSHGAESVAVMSILFAHSSFDDSNIDKSIDDTIIDIQQLDMDILTYPDPLNWTFSKDVLDISGVHLDTIGMDTEQEYLPDSIHCEALQHLWFCLQSSELGKWFVLPTKEHNIQLCSIKTNRAGSPVISYTVEIFVNFEWLLRIPKGILDWKKHPVLMHLPLHIKTIDDAKEVIGEIDYAKHCNGIDDPKFDQLVTKHKGRFFDRCGEHMFD